MMEETPIEQSQEMQQAQQVQSAVNNEPQIGGRKRRMRAGTLSILAQILFGAGLATLWIISDFGDGDMIGIVIGAVLAVIG